MYAAPKHTAFKQNYKRQYIGYVVGFYSCLTGRLIDAIEREFKEPITSRNYGEVKRIIDFNNWKKGN